MSDSQAAPGFNPNDRSTWAGGAPDGEEQQKSNGPDVSILRLNRRPPPRFPTAIFGPEWSRWLTGTAEAAAAPVDYVGASLIAVSSALIGNARWAEAWPGWSEPPHLWLGLVGDSGDGKSPATAVAFRKVVPELERRMIGDYPEQLREWESNTQVAKQRRRAWEVEVAAAVKKHEQPPIKPPDADPEPQPEEPRLVLHDVTIEKVGVLLAAAAPKGLLMVRDELTGFLLGMDAYNPAARPFWLECWNGGPYRIDRKNSPPISVIRNVVAWCGGIQPERLVEVMKTPDDGLLARFIWVWPDPIPFRRSRVPSDVEFATRSLDRLRELDFQHHSDGTFAPYFVPLEERAAARLEAFGAAMQRRRDLSTGPLRSAFGKARGLALRLSLVIEFLWWCERDGFYPPPTVISDTALEAATGWVSDYAMPMAERTFGDAACTQADRNITTLARWVAQERPAEVHVRTMQREERLAGLTDAETIHAACRALVDAGWLIPPPPGTRRQRAVQAYSVDPALWAALDA
jgi:hypothetical protein